MQETCQMVAQLANEADFPKMGWHGQCVGRGSSHFAQENAGAKICSCPLRAWSV